MNDTVGTRIAKARLDKGWNQTTLAAILGTTQTCISYWENGARDITVTNLLHIALALGVPAANLLPTTTPDTPPLDLTELTQDLRDLLTRLETITHSNQETQP